MLRESPHPGVEVDHDRAYRQPFIPFGKRAYVRRYRIDTTIDTLVVVRGCRGNRGNSRIDSIAFCTAQLATGSQSFGTWGSPVSTISPHSPHTP